MNMNRLETICSLIPKAAVIADIGCDHGKVSEYIIKNGLAERLIVNDISTASLQKAKDLLSEFTGKKKVTFLCCDGGLLPAGIDCAVIAGMGGREILRIINAIKPSMAVLAPQGYAPELRQALQKSYRTERDTTVQDGGKFYDILKLTSQPDCPQALDACAALYGYEYRVKNAALKERLKRDMRNLQSYKQTPENLEKLKIVQEVLQWQ